MADNIELKNNLMSFRETFREYTDYYTVIGGTACMILMEEANRDFRATKDIDMILIMEDGGREFCEIFWEYILRGKYTCGWKGSEPHYYRFTEPLPGFPSQIELFSRRADFELDSRIIPVHIDDDVSSLSAIALDEDFYAFMKEGRRVVDDISILGTEYIIPFKMYAWLNNTDLKKRGEKVNSDDIKKHKNDVFRLLPLINPDVKIQTGGNVRGTVFLLLRRWGRKLLLMNFSLTGEQKKMHWIYSEKYTCEKRY
ncbi:MAG: hypothetical protein E7282_05910 [Lachnospiraceae bacterium]|nr:hypothetical protein [Lachnospiraceae bacterium]